MSTNILEGTHPAPKFRRRGTPRGFRALTKEVPTCPGHFSVTCDLSQIWRSGCLPLATYNMSVYPFKKASWDSTTDWFWVVIFMYCTTWCAVAQKSGNGELQHFGGLATNKSHGGFTGWCLQLWRQKNNRFWTSPCSAWIILSHPLQKKWSSVKSLLGPLVFIIYMPGSLRL